MMDEYMIVIVLLTMLNIFAPVIRKWLFPKSKQGGGKEKVAAASADPKCFKKDELNIMGASKYDLISHSESSTEPIENSNEKTNINPNTFVKVEKSEGQTTTPEPPNGKDILSDELVKEIFVEENSTLNIDVEMEFWDDHVDYDNPDIGEAEMLAKYNEDGMTYEELVEAYNLVKDKTDERIEGARVIYLAEKGDYFQAMIDKSDETKTFVDKMVEKHWNSYKRSDSETVKTEMFDITSVTQNY